MIDRGLPDAPSRYAGSDFGPGLAGFRCRLAIVSELSVRPYARQFREPVPKMATASGHAIPGWLIPRKFTCHGMRPRERSTHEGARPDPSDEEWAWIEPLLPPPSKRGRPRTTDPREALVLDGHHGMPVHCTVSPGFQGPELFLQAADRRAFRACGDVFRGLLRQLAGRSREPGAMTARASEPGNILVTMSARRR